MFPFLFLELREIKVQQEPACQRNQTMQQPTPSDWTFNNGCVEAPCSLHCKRTRFALPPCSARLKPISQSWPWNVLRCMEVTTASQLKSLRAHCKLSLGPATPCRSLHGLPKITAHRGGRPGRRSRTADRSLCARHSFPQTTHFCTWNRKVSPVPVLHRLKGLQWLCSHLLLSRHHCHFSTYLGLSLCRILGPGFFRWLLTIVGQKVQKRKKITLQSEWDSKGKNSTLFTE